MKKILILAGSAALVAGAHANIVTNGSFEFGTDPGSFTTVGTGGTNITGWSVDSGSVDYIGNYWQASDGSRSLDMGGNTNGSISQVLATTIGQIYHLTFDLSGNPDTRPADGAYTVGVTAGDLNGNFSFVQNPWTNTKTNMEWQGQSAYFKATSTLTTLTFLDVAPPSSPWGPALDNVQVNAVPEPFTMSLGLASAGLFLRRRLKAKKA